MKKHYLTLLLGTCIWGLLNIQPASAQNNQTLYRTKIKHTAEKITIDGALDEAAWQSAEVAGDFWQKWPRDDMRAERKTEVRLIWDDNFFYIGTTCYDTSKQHIIQTLKRDIDYWDSDGFSVILDPVNQKTNGFLFGVTAAGVQTEGLVQLFDEPSMEWDNRWYSEVKQYQDRWTIEIAIPFKTLRYEEGKTVWGINFIRNDIKNNQYHTWTQVPQQFPGVDLGYLGALDWDTAPPRPKGNLAIIPYATGGINADYEEKEGIKLTGNAGADAKIALSSSLNLDLTFNPDFSQIEVDQQVTNLTRFDIFFPERRTFFLENSDLFANFGFPNTRPFFSRTIGLDKDAQPLPILMGARLSGNLDKNWRIGLMNMQTGKKGDTQAQNYSAAAFQRSLFKRSNIKALFLNRHTIDGITPVYDDYSRNFDAEFTFQDVAGKWTSWAGYHQSFKPRIKGDNKFYNTGFWYNGRNFQTVADFTHMGTQYYADMGFINRLENYDAERDTTIRSGYNQFFNEINYTIFPKKSKKINTLGFAFESFLVLNPDGTFNERFNSLRSGMELKNASEFSFQLDNNSVDLLFPFSFTDEDPLPAERYDNYRINAGYESDNRKAFSFEIEGEYWWQFYSGTLTTARLGLLYRRQPWGNFSIDFEFNDLKLPEPYGKSQLLLLRPRIEINFSRSVFWTTFLQLNTQGGNFNVNSRLQWRFAPMSDFFLVYTDNYFAETDTIDGRFRFTNFAPRNRAIVFKFSYWLNL